MKWNRTDGTRRGLVQGIFYGLIPHVGCIAFVTFSILGVAAAAALFRPLLLNPYFFHILVALSLLFATVSSVLYLRKNGLLSLVGMQRKRKYLSVMYGSTIGVNLLMFTMIFPLLANMSFAGVADSSIILQVSIPCPGHAPLISEELKSIDGVAGVRFNFPNIFDVKYDSTKISKQQILSLEVFKTYNATVINETCIQQ